MDTVTLAVVVPATDEPATLECCLAAIEAAIEPPDQIVVVRRPAGTGPAAARNDGVRQTESDIVVFVDSDVLVHADAFTRVRRAFSREDTPVAIFGSYDNRVVTRGPVAAFRNLLHHVVHQRSAGEVRTFWAGLGAVRREDFDAVGGFDGERYPHPSIEDIELGGRLAERGRIVLDPELQGTHLKQWTFASMVRTDFSRRGIPWIELLSTKREFPATLNLGMRERASVVAALMVAWGIVRRRPVVAAAGLGAEVVLNHDLVSLLHRRVGIGGAIAGVGLHTVHQLTAVAAVPAGLIAAMQRERSHRR